MWIIYAEENKPATGIKQLPVNYVIGFIWLQFIVIWPQSISVQSKSGEAILYFFHILNAHFTILPQPFNKNSLPSIQWLPKIHLAKS